MLSREGHGCQSNIKFLAHSVQSIEEPLISPELGLKGFADAILDVTTKTFVLQSHSRTYTQPIGSESSYMCLELKTGHNQNTQSAHMAQLALYVLMVQGRYGTRISQQVGQSNCIAKTVSKVASAGGILVYLNHQSIRSVHVSPLLHEIKSLIGQRNVVASEISRASKPRGIVLSYEDERTEEESDTSR